MPKAAVAIVLFGFVLAASGSTSATAMQVVPLSKCVATNLNGEIVDAGWRRWLGAHALHVVLARQVGPRSLPVAISWQSGRQASASFLAAVAFRQPQDHVAVALARPP
jgi:H+/gluconate symporter-like permease